MDAFDTLGLSPALDLDATVLEQRYRDLQRKLHPDRFAQASSSEKRAALARAVAVNEAYRALRDTLKRAEILLARYGGQLQGEPADPELLMHVMELREGLAEARAKKDFAAVEQLAREVETMEQANLGELRAALAKLAQGEKEALSQAQRALGRLRYCRRFHDEVARYEDELLE